MEIISSENKTLKTEKDGKYPGLSNNNKLSAVEERGLLGKIGFLFEKIASFIEVPEQKEFRKKQELDQAKENFIKTQTNYIFKRKIDELIDTREKYDLKIPAAAIDYNRFVRGKDDEPIDKTALTNRAMEALKNQIFAEENGEESYIDYLYTEGKVHDYADEAEAMQDLYEGMSQDEYNMWRYKAERGLEALIKRIEKLLSERPGYEPDTLTSVLNYRLYQIIKDRDVWKRSEEETRKNIEKRFGDDLLGNALYPLSVENFSEFSTGLQALGVLSPNYKFISRNVAKVDIYQKGYELFSELAKEKEIALAIAKNMELLRTENFDELIGKNKDNFSKFLLEKIETLKNLQENSTLSKRNMDIYKRELALAIHNFPEVVLAEKLGADLNLRNMASTEEYQKYKVNMFTIGGHVKRNYDLLKSFAEFRAQNGFKNTEILERVTSKEAYDENYDLEESDVKAIKEILDKDKAGFEDEYKFAKYLDIQEKLLRTTSLSANFDWVANENSRYVINALEKLSADFEELYKETYNNREALLIDKKAMTFYEDIKNGTIKPSENGEVVEFLNRFKDELRDYLPIEWRVSPLASTIGQALGVLNINNQEVSRSNPGYIEAYQGTIDLLKNKIGVSEQDMRNMLSISSMSERPKSKIHDLVKLLELGFDPKLESKGYDPLGSLAKIDNFYEKYSIVEDRRRNDLVRVDALDNLLAFEKKESFKEKLENGTETLESLKEKYSNYQKLLDDAKVVLKKYIEAESKGFRSLAGYNDYKLEMAPMNFDDLADGVKERIKLKTIDTNLKLIREVADGKHQKFIEKIIDLVKDEYKGPVNMQALVTQVYTRGAKAVIAKEGLDGRTKAAKFIKSVEKTIKSMSEPSL